ncbi:hypothetical protein E4U19_002961 [Claviceps sp. Clav32 group G5]|nr:hypothetical protein E4U19_002961 [Claviceps sp. Clav32 group G5]
MSDSIQPRISSSCRFTSSETMQKRPRRAKWLTKGQHGYRLSGEKTGMDRSSYISPTLE